MSISGALNNALSGLTATSRMAEVVSSNVSNALTDGYARRRVDLSSVQIGSKGAGVRIDGITRLSDRGLLADRRLADAGVGQAQIGADALQSLTRTFGDIGDPGSLGGRLAAFETALLSAASDPASDLRLGNAVTRLGEVLDTLRSQSQTVQAERQAADRTIAKQVDTLNAALAQVERLNADIQRLQSAGQDPSGLLDARQNAIDSIADIVPVRELDRQNGKVALMTTSGTLLLDGPAPTFTFTSTPVITADMTLASGALSGIAMNGQPLDPANGFGRLAGGALSAAFDLRDNTLVTAQAGLDTIAEDLMTRFAAPGVDPTLTPTDPGLVTDRGAVLDPANLTGLSQRLTLNSAVDPAAGGTATRLRDGLQALLPGPVGQSAQLNAWIDALRSPQALASGAPATTAAGRIADFTASIGSLRTAAESDLSFETARWETLRETELSKGVDTDQEMQQLLRIEQAYAANARVMQTVDQLMQRLMEI